jgi:hypothetical protein
MGVQRTALCAHKIDAILKLESTRLPSRSLGAAPLNGKPFGGTLAARLVKQYLT